MNTAISPSRTTESSSGSPENRIESGRQYIHRFSWNVARKKTRKCSNISVKKYLKRTKVRDERGLRIRPDLS